MSEAVIGWCDVTPNASRPVHAHCGSLGIGLLPAFRGKGIGRSLILTTLAAAFEFGLTRIELNVVEGNTNAVALYESIGFRKEGLHRNANRIDGKYENLYSMALLQEEQPQYGS
jgi:RimJ/RimL family protein N-acetyltransferase